ncbi:hypothetical protein GCM10020331_103350 [Ectobacillus funiculus]
MKNERIGDEIATEKYAGFYTVFFGMLDKQLEPKKTRTTRALHKNPVYVINSEIARNPVLARMPWAWLLPIMTCYVNLTCIQYAFVTPFLKSIENRKNRIG